MENKNEFEVSCQVEVQLSPCPGNLKLNACISMEVRTSGDMSNVGRAAPVVVLAPPTTMKTDPGMARTGIVRYGRRPAKPYDGTLGRGSR